MKRSEAYHILGKMWDDATPEQAEAISIALNDIEFVDLMPNDMVAVVRCKDCELWDPDPDTYGDSIGPKGKCMKSFETTICDDFCSYGERRADDATD